MPFPKSRQVYEGRRIVGVWLPRGMSDEWDAKALATITADLLPECAATVEVGA